jgi:hypothetical protein
MTVDPAVKLRCHRGIVRKAFGENLGHLAVEEDIYLLSTAMYIEILCEQFSVQRQ